jgi:glycerophosphoryl diester phosphodiesterase
MIKNDIIMKRDMDLLRAILLSVEAEEHGFAPDIKIPDYTQEEIGYHAVLLGEAGLAVVANITTLDSKSPQARIIRLTWSGHEFLDAARDKTIWNQAKDKIGSASIQIWMAMLTTLIQKKLGL